jgi:hypothetical protein
VEITPPLGLPMGGRGPTSTTGREILAPLLLQAIVLHDANGARTVWISLDNIGMCDAVTAPMRESIAAQAGTDPAQIIINFSHTHSGPLTTYERHAEKTDKPEGIASYERAVHARAVEATARAIDRMQPVDVHWIEGQTHIGINRRLPDENGEILMHPNPESPYSSDLWILDLRGASGRCLAFSCGCHPVIVYQFADDSISPDYPGRCREILRERLGKEVHTQFFQSLTGNVRPRAMADLDNNVFRPSTPEDVVSTALRLADDIAIALLEDEGEPIRLVLAGAAGAFALVRDEPPPLSTWEDLAQRETGSAQTVARYWIERYRNGPPLTRDLKWPVGLIRLNADHVIAWLGGEPVAEWMPLLQHALDGHRMAAWGYTNEVTGYLPTDSLLPEGGDEVDRGNHYTSHGPARFRPGIDKAVLNALGGLHFPSQETS